MKQRLAPSPTDSSCILLVDDNDHGLIARRALLQELGYSIATASSGEEGFALFSKEKFDLVITDYKMSEMNGLELIRLIRSANPSTRIILLSGYVDPLGLNEQTTGADVVISKTSGEVSNLVRSVTRLLSRRVPRKPPASHKPVLMRAQAHGA